MTNRQIIYLMILVATLYIIVKILVMTKIL